MSWNLPCSRGIPYGTSWGRTELQHLLCYWFCEECLYLPHFIFKKFYFFMFVGVFFFFVQLVECFVLKYSWYSKKFLLIMLCINCNPIVNKQLDECLQ